MPRIQLIQLRRGTAAEWVTQNPVLADGEEGHETDTGKRKIGDGVNPWVLLDYIFDGGGAISEAEDNYWAKEAAKLDPLAYSFLTGANTVVGPVPAGKAWFLANGWGILSSLTRVDTGCTVVSGSPTFTDPSLTAADAGLYVFGTGIASRYLLEASAGVGRLSGNASAASDTGSYTLFSTRYHRELNAKDSIMLPAGKTLTICPFGGYAYVCKPEQVIPSPYGTGTDTRYINDPKGLYYTRMELLQSLTLHDIDGVVAPAAPMPTNTTVPFPDDFTHGLVTASYSQDCAWVGFTGPSGAMNVMDEISDQHQTRFARATFAPFTRAIFTGWFCAGSNVAGTSQLAVGSGHGGGTNPYGPQGGASYYKLPEGW